MRFATFVNSKPNGTMRRQDQERTEGYVLMVQSCGQRQVTIQVQHRCGIRYCQATQKRCTISHVRTVTIFLFEKAVAQEVAKQHGRLSLIEKRIGCRKVDNLSLAMVQLLSTVEKVLVLRWALHADSVACHLSEMKMSPRSNPRVWMFSTSLHDHGAWGLRSNASLGCSKTLKTT